MINEGLQTTNATRSATGRKPGMVTALFHDRETAEHAYHAVSERGYGQSDINVVMSDETRKTYFTDAGLPKTELGNKAAAGAGVGSAVGGTIGAIAAAVAAVGTSLAIPGLGIVIAGPIAAALAGAGAGGLTGGVVGALIGSGIPEERVKHYEKGLKEGGILLGVQARTADDAREIEEIWKRHKAEHVYS